MKLWFSQLWMRFLQLRREAWKIQDFNEFWTRDLAIPVRRSNQINYEATDDGNCKNCVHNWEDHSFTWFQIHSSMYDLFHLSFHQTVFMLMYICRRETFRWRRADDLCSCLGWGIRRMMPKHCDTVDSQFSRHLKLRANGHSSQHC